MPDIKLIRKRWGGILQMLFITYKGKIKMLIIFIYACHMTYFKWIWAYDFRFTKSVSSTPTHSVHIWYFKSPNEKGTLMWLAQPRRSSIVYHYWIVHDNYSENVCAYVRANSNSGLMSGISHQHQCNTRNPNNRKQALNEFSAPNCPRKFSKSVWNRLSETSSQTLVHTEPWINVLYILLIHLPVKQIFISVITLHARS